MIHLQNRPCRSESARRPKSWATRFATLLIAVAGWGHAQEPAWELRACADPLAMPFSGREEPGLENAIAEILADEMGAELTYDWVPFSPDMVNLNLRGGTCDVMLGVPDGHMDQSTTIEYYRSPYVFVTRADAPFEIGSLDDRILADLAIGVQNPGIPPHDALINRGYASNIVGPKSGEPNPTDRVLREVAAGEIDVGIIWGPVAGYYAPRSDVPLDVQPVTPQFDPPFLSMSFSMTMAVRQGDYQLRDLLDRAIAARWEDIQAALRDYGVPLIESPAPVVSLDEPDEREVATIGVLGPITSGRQTNATSLYDLAGDAMRNGGLLGERDAPERYPDTEFAFLYATTPSAASAVRAAERLIATEGVDALVGGLGEQQAARIGGVAAEHDLLFLDAGSTDLTVRNTCMPTTLHVAASSSAYLDVLVDHHARQGARSWHLVHEATEEGRARAGAARAAIERHGAGGALEASTAVEPLAPSYFQTFQAIEESGVEAVLLMLGAADQIVFEAQLDSFGLDVLVAPLSHPVQQTRDYLGAERDRTAPTGDMVRVLAWEPNRAVGSDMSERYAARFGQPMQSSAYAGYQAVMAAAEALDATESSDLNELIAYLTAEGRFLDGPKGAGVSFRASDRQLRQPLDLTEVLVDAEWRNTVDGKLGIASFVATVPDTAGAASDAEAAELLDGIGIHRAACEAPQ